MREDDDTGSAQAMVEQGLEHHRAGQLAEAARCYTAAVSLDPDHADAHNLRGLARLQAGDAKGALASIDSAVALRPDIAHYHLSRGKACAAMGDTDMALTAYREAVRLNPQFVEALNDLGNTLLAAGDVQRALESYEQALAAEPGFVLARNNILNTLINAGRYLEAEARCRTVLETAPTDVDALLFISRALDFLGRSAEAERLLSDSLAAGSGSSDYLAQLGYLQSKLGREEQAAATLEQALTISNGLPEHLQQVADTFVRLGDLDRAKEIYLGILRVHPGLAAVWHALSRLPKERIEADQMAVLRQLSNSGVANPLDAAAAHFALGNFLEREQRYDEAFAAFKTGREYYRKAAVQSGARPYDLETERGYLEILTGFFTADKFSRYRHRGQIAGSQRPRYLVILGLPRSGTTLVEQILASHAAVHSLGESGLLDRAVKKFIDGRGGNEDVARQLARLDDIRTAMIVNEFSNSVQASRPGADVYTDKSINNSYHAWALAMSQADVRVIVCRRDLRDVGLSCFQSPFELTSHTWSWELEQVGRFCAMHEKLLDHWVSVLPLPVMEVRYEELVTDFENRARELIAFCGLSWDPNCLNFHQSKRAVLTNSNAQVRVPVYTSSVGRHANYGEHLAPLFEQLASG